MKNKVIISLIAVLFVCTTAMTAAAKTTTLSFAIHHGPTDVHTKLIEQWISEVEKRTDGKVKFDLYPGQSLIKAPQTYDGIVNGMVDMGWSILQYTRGRFPLMDFINLPLGWPSGKVNTAIINEVIEKFQPAELSDTKVLYLTAHGPGHVHTKKVAVKTMEDWKGMKIRSNGPIAEMIKLLGGTPVSLPMPELYQALQKGVVDGGIWDFSASADWKLAEVAKYDIVSEETAYSLGFFVVMNKDKWNSLDPEVQKVIDDMSLSQIQKHGAAWSEADERGLAFSKKLGDEIIQIDPAESMRWRKAVQPVVDEYIQTCEKKGLPGKEVVEYVEKRIAEARAGNFESKYMMK